MAQAEFSHVAILADLQLRNSRCFESLPLQFESGWLDCDRTRQMYPIARVPAGASQKFVTATSLDWREEEGPIFELRDGKVRQK